MGCAPERKFGRRRRNLVIVWLFLMISSWSCVEGRAIPKVVEVEGNPDSTLMNKTRGNVVMVRRALIGSRPPRCERRCSSCRPCEAVQVPIVSRKLKDQQLRTRSNHYQLNATPTIAYSRSDDTSNYKPMRWKCKCGNFMFNP